MSLACLLACSGHGGRRLQPHLSGLDSQHKIAAVEDSRKVFADSRGEQKCASLQVQTVYRRVSRHY